MNLRILVTELLLSGMPADLVLWTPLPDIKSLAEDVRFLQSREKQENLWLHNVAAQGGPKDVSSAAQVLKPKKKSDDDRSRLASQFGKRGRGDLASQFKKGKRKSNASR